MASHKDLCIHETSTTGSGTLTLGSSPSLGNSGQPARSLAAGDDAKSYRYYLENGVDGWESGTGVYTHSGTTFTRVLKYSSTGSLLNLTTPSRVYIGDVTQEDLEALFLGISTLQAAPKVGRTEIKITRTSTTEIEIAPCIIPNHDGSAFIQVGTAITLDLTVSGDFVNGSSRLTSTWFHVLIGHLTSDGSVVAALSTTLAKPSAWDDWQMIGAVQTNSTGSGEFRKFVQDDRYFGLDEEANLYDNTSPPTTATALRCWCPPMACMAHLGIAIRNPSGGSYLLLRSSSGGDNNKSVNLSNGTYVDNIELKRPTDSSGQIWFLLFAAVTFDQFYFFGIGFDYPIGAAGSV